MLHSMLFLLSALVPLADVVTAPSKDVQAHLSDRSLRNIPAVPIKNARLSQLFGGSDEANKRSVGAVRRSHFKGLALRRDQWAEGLWPRGEVPYEIAPEYTFQERSKIQLAMDAFRKHTCIKFRPRTPSDMYYLSISNNFNPGKCSSHVGRQGIAGSRTPEGKFKTKMNLHRDCFDQSTLLHELMHAIGFEHEHQREDRNPLINAALDPHGDDKDNKYSLNHKIYSRTDAYYMGSYDPESIMHYSFPNFKNYARQYFSKSDINNINKLYNCTVQHSSTTEPVFTVQHYSTKSPLKGGQRFIYHEPFIPIGIFGHLIAVGVLVGSVFAYHNISL
ncbi:unnamed protein product [Cylicocyclus nassatus]|uniref:Metalloendopeptidase n=1 Tax=Cylicocyclus nassatus TaxID=53992 RepID=A0AA36GZN8_CYLNA|nr:unnamed protein product [Cylicocyclus nassatus]